MKYMLVLLLVFNFLKANDQFSKISNKTYVQFNTGSSFVFIAEDKKNNVFTIVSEANVPVKADGSYCYLEGKIDKNFPDHKHIPDKYCKGKPPYKNIIKTYHTVFDKFMVYPRYNDDMKYVKPFPLPNNLSNDMLNFIDYYGNIGNKTQNFKQKFHLKNNTIIGLTIVSLGTRSHGQCSSISSHLISLKVNNHIFFKEILTDKCIGYNIDKIKINLKKKIVTLNVMDTLESEKTKTLTIPFSYFIKKNGMEYITEDEFYRFQTSLTP